MQLDRDAPFSSMNTASLSPPSPSLQLTPRSYATIPQSNVSPAATVWAALRTEVPEEAGRPPPEAKSPLGTVAEAVVEAAAEDAAPEEAAADEDAGETM